MNCDAFDLRRRRQSATRREAIKNQKSKIKNRLPFLILLLNIACVTTAELLLRTGASSTAHTSVFGIAALDSPYTVAGIVFHVTGFIFWMIALRSVPLTLAYNFTAVNQGLVPLAAWLLLRGENMPPQKILGIALVLTGFVLLVPMLAKVEHETDAPATEPVGGQS